MSDEESSYTEISKTKITFDETGEWIFIPHSDNDKMSKSYQIRIGANLTDAARYRWLRDNVFDVNCEGRPADCIAKWMLPRLVAEDSTGRKFTFDEIIDIQMRRSKSE